MCRKCFCLAEDVVIESMKSKFSDDVVYGPFRGFSGQKIHDILSNSIDDPFATDAVYENILRGFVGIKKSVVSSNSSGTVSPRYVQGIPKEYWEFHEALDFLSIHNPTRMKAIEQLESNYHRSIQSLKIQKKSALTSLQTRQSLETDMLTNQRDYSKAELEALVGQHIAEIDGLLSHWESEIRSLQTVQLREYRELVMEVFGSEKMGKIGDEGMEIGERKNCSIEKWQRPVLPVGTEWVKMTPIAALGSGTCSAARCIRLLHVRGEDFVSSVITPIISPNEDFDPEELCLVENRDKKTCGVILGISDDLMLRSNQDTHLFQILDKCPVDCRWPSFIDQIGAVKSVSGKNSSVIVTRHSNLGLGVKFLLHKIFNSGSDEVRIEDVLNLLEIADSLRIERLYVADVLSVDSRSPTVLDKSTRPDRAREFLHVLRIAISRLDNRGGLREIVLIESS